ncbi:MAG TPA: hypothetical protein ENJ32_03475 [Crenotrichaceae bacterium]|nr:hypothetical protein [Crenotrichaceae bacterium]
MAGIIPIAIAFVVAYWFFITAKRADLKENEPWTWAFVGGICFYAAAKLTMFVLTKVFVISLIEGNDTSMPRLLIIGAGCMIGVILSIFVHAKLLPIAKKA